MGLRVLRFNDDAGLNVLTQWPGAIGVARDRANFDRHRSIQTRRENDFLQNAHPFDAATQVGS